MKNIKEYDNLNSTEQENFLAHSAANLAQKMYYDHDRKGLEVLVNNLETIAEHARNCLDCLEILHKKGDVFAKIYLLLEYMGKGAISEEFVSGLEELTERAHECLAQSEGVIPTGEEEKKLLAKLGNIIDSKTAEPEPEENEN